jgi:hypothetical protein
LARDFRCTLGVALAATAATCSTISPTVRQSFTKNGLDRAAFRNEVPKESLELVQLNRPLDDRNELDTQVGVTDVARKRCTSFVMGAGWVANTAK